jgi:flap endonuclease-1
MRLGFLCAENGANVAGARHGMCDFKRDMGVAISKLLPKKQIQLADLAGNWLAVDAFNFIYAFLAAIRHRMTGEPLRDHRGRVTSHLSGLWYRTICFLEAGIKPIYVFDGEFPRFKVRTVEKRRAARKTAERKWKEARRKGQPALKFGQAATTVDSGILDSAKTLLDLMGVPWVDAPSEGEAQCAWMCHEGLVFATASQDLDSVLFGSPRLVRNLATIEGGIAGSIDSELIELDDVLEKLELTREQFVLLGLLVGTDYNEGVKGVGPADALRRVKEYQTFERVLAKTPLAADADIRKIYEFFLNPPHTTEGRLELKAPAIEGLYRYLVHDHDFSPERVSATLQRLSSKGQVVSSTKVQSLAAR